MIPNTKYTNLIFYLFYRIRSINPKYEMNIDGFLLSSLELIHTHRTLNYYVLFWERGLRTEEVVNSPPGRLRSQNIKVLGPYCVSMPLFSCDRLNRDGIWYNG